MNTYKDPQYRGYYLGKIGAALLVLLILVVAVTAARNRGLLPAPAAAPATSAVESATPGAEPVTSTVGAAQSTPEGAATALGAAESGSTAEIGLDAESTAAPEAQASEAGAAPATGAPKAAQAPAPGTAPAAETAAVRTGESPVPLAAATAASGAVQAPATGAAEKDVAVSGTVNGVTNAVSTSSPSALSTTLGIPSGYQTYTQSGSHLTANININAPAAFEISTDGATPIITVSTSSLSAFSTMVGTPSTAQTYTVSGSDLTANININAPAGFEISEDGSIYSSSLTLTQSGGTVATTIIYVRLTGAAEGSYGGNITHTSTGALPTAAPASGPAAAATATPGTGPAAAATAASGSGSAAAATAAPGAGPAATGKPAATATPATTGSAAAASPTTAAAMGPATASPELTISYYVVGKAGQVTLAGTGRPGAPIEIIQGGAVIGKIVITGEGTWSYTYVAPPGTQVAAVQYEGRPGTRSAPVTFKSTGTASGTAAQTATPARAAATAQSPSATPAPTASAVAGAGQAYIVQPGEFLRLLALRFYGDEAEWPVIYNGTNAMAARDSSFAVISDPNLIIAGWKIWIPAN
jgi:hypothetical protein